MHGIDVSNNNRPDTIDWNGVEFCFIKTSEGLSYTDPYFNGPIHSYLDDCVSRGVKWAPYHFAHPDVNSAAAEVQFFLAKFSGHTPDMGPALDIETRGTGAAHRDPLLIMGPDALAAWIDEFNQHVYDTLKIQPFPYLYTFRSYADKLYPRVSPAWWRWLATAAGQPGGYKSYMVNGREYVVAIEQWGSPGGIDANEAYGSLGPPPIVPRELPNSTEASEMNTVVLPDGTIVVTVVGTDDAVYATRSTDGGVTWSANIKVGDANTAVRNPI